MIDKDSLTQVSSWKWDCHISSISILRCDIANLLIAVLHRDGDGRRQRVAMTRAGLQPKPAAIGHQLILFKCSSCTAWTPQYYVGGWPRRMACNSRGIGFHRLRDGRSETSGANERASERKSVEWAWMNVVWWSTDDRRSSRTSYSSSRSRGKRKLIEFSQPIRRPLRNFTSTDRSNREADIREWCWIT